MKTTNNFLKPLVVAVFFTTFLFFTSCGGSDDSSGGNSSDTTAFVRVKIDGEEVFYKEDTNPGKAGAFILDVPMGIPGVNQTPENSLMIVSNIPGESSMIFHQNVTATIKSLYEGSTGTFNLSGYDSKVHFTNNADPNYKYYFNMNNSGTLTLTKVGGNHGNIGKMAKGKITGIAEKTTTTAPYVTTMVEVEIEFNGGI